MTPQERYNAGLAKEATKRRKRVAAMRRTGMTLEQIGDVLGVTRQRVYAILKRGSKKA